ncbi:hypothetical protein IDJ81_08470 [Tsuneonella flava]|uniref:Uncharacterized protein n=1 Tax=Tsuneonella flava TaxID=2055955 RepID=A0ABX7KA90_9SPHN|nr:hypothetical protein [Tsuneonella flava]QSB43435.1 hypothetical protein IDJ81_08470 [Tsuneonella flava]
MIRWCIMIAAGTIVAVLTIAHPSVLAENSFLDAFISHEILALLIVILTITLASIGNIHLTLSRMVQRFENRAEGELAATPARNEINSSGWSLLYAFAVCTVILLVKGGTDSNAYAQSATNGAGLVILLFNMLVLKDIYDTVYDLVKSDGGAREHEQNDATRGD